MRASLFWGPRDGWGVAVWDGDRAVAWLPGFATMWDAWAFCFAACGLDASAGMLNRKAFLRPPRRRADLADLPLFRGV